MREPESGTAEALKRRGKEEERGRDALFFPREDVDGSVFGGEAQGEGGGDEADGVVEGNVVVGEGDGVIEEAGAEGAGSGVEVEADEDALVFGIEDDALVGDPLEDLARGCVLEAEVREADVDEFALELEARGARGVVVGRCRLGGGIETGRKFGDVDGAAGVTRRGDEGAAVEGPGGVLEEAIDVGVDGAGWLGAFEDGVLGGEVCRGEEEDGREDEMATMKARRGTRWEGHESFRGLRICFHVLRGS